MEYRHDGHHRCSQCEEFARILGAEILTSTNDLCVVTFLRNIP